MFHSNAAAPELALLLRLWFWPKKGLLSTNPFWAALAANRKQFDNVGEELKIAEQESRLVKLDVVSKERERAGSRRVLEDGAAHPG